MHVQSTHGIYFAKRKQLELNEEFNHLPETPQTSVKLRGKVAALTRLIKLWVPIGKVLYLSGVPLPSGDTVRGRAKDDALFEGWAPTFAQHDTNDNKARRVCERFCSTFDWSLMTPVCIQSFLSFLASVAHSSPGPDGIPYAAWRAAGFLGSETLYILYSSFAGGGLPPRGFNSGLFVFPPKGRSAGIVGKLLEIYVKRAHSP